MTGVQTCALPIWKIILNKDFGYGYIYEVIMEDAKVVSVKPGVSAL